MKEQRQITRTVTFDAETWKMLGILAEDEPFEGNRSLCLRALTRRRFKERQHKNLAEIYLAQEGEESDRTGNS